jgi:LacI family transcriptional regulator
VTTKVSIREVAERAGVSLGTVSNVLNHPQRVAAATRRRVEEVIGELRFVRNESARHLRAGRSRTIGLVVLDVTNPFFTDVARGVEDRANASDIAVILCNSDANPAKERSYLQMLAEQRVLGVLIVPLRSGAQAFPEALERRIPLVVVDAKASRSQRCSVSTDDVAGGALAVEHLLGMGHRHIAFVSGVERPHQVAGRLRGAKRSIDASGARATLTALNVPSMDVAGGRDAAEQLLARPRRERPTAAFCTNDLLALGMLQALIQSGASVPGDVAIVGYDDIEFAGAAAVPLSSIRQPRHRLGFEAADLLLEEADEPEHAHQQRVFEPQLIVRQSSATAHGGSVRRR